MTVHAGPFINVLQSIVQDKTFYSPLAAFWAARAPRRRHKHRPWSDITSIAPVLCAAAALQEGKELAAVMSSSTT
eukprot:m.45871 g.45871  ORF g.45871 m.45871 type:complete len:75 (+) comp12208_c1_seq2:164-388(+)